ncbi:WDGH domain-containing protein [Herbidospora mongoliensis]|uniref:WDGH domain-containing protein n=1 Tax=Herbidospora mongoliensis TaxID=688067 RepID=UPI00082CB62E|nr:hypothetical protein [Herbidospora mongoliensis]
MADENPIYRERAHLIAHLATVYPAVIVLGSDRENPTWPVIFVDTPQGQLSWHLSGDDMDLFKHVRITTGEHAPAWDGHTTPEKYERLDALTADRVKAAPDGPDALPSLATGSIVLVMGKRYVIDKRRHFSLADGLPVHVELELIPDRDGE